MSYDASDGYELLFGGQDPATNNETWTYSGGQWTELRPSLSPSPRQDAMMTYDTADGYEVLFGGNNGAGGYLSDTWKFQAGVWTELSPTTSPSARSAGAITYDVADGYVLLFGGSGPGPLGDTWKFHAGQWTLLHPPISPPPRYAAAIANSTSAGPITLFGGADGQTLADTWAFEAGNWTQVSASSSPSGRDYAEATFDGGIGKVLLFGGYNGTDLGDTWEYSGGSWIQLSPTTSPPSREDGLLSYDPDEGYTVLFGGTSGGALEGDTWAYLGNTGGPLTSVSVSPASTSVVVGGAASFTALASCSRPCSPGVIYHWTLLGSLGRIAPAYGPSTTFTAWNTTGTAQVEVEGMWNGTSRFANSTVTIVPAGPILSQVLLTAGSTEISTNSSDTLSAVAVCTGGRCGNGTLFGWSANNSIGVLSPTSGSYTNFTAGASAGETQVTVRVSLNGVNRNATVNLTVYRGIHTCAGCSPSLYLPLALLSVAVIGVALVVVAVTRRRRSRTAPGANGRQYATKPGEGAPKSPTKNVSSLGPGGSPRDNSAHFSTAVSVPTRPSEPPIQPEDGSSWVGPPTLPPARFPTSVSGPAGTPPNRRRCPICGGWNDVDFRFCQKCGRDLPAREV